MMMNLLLLLLHTCSYLLNHLFISCIVINRGYAHLGGYFYKKITCAGFLDILHLLRARNSKKSYLLSLTYYVGRKT